VKKKLNLNIDSISILDIEGANKVKGGTGMGCFTVDLSKQMVDNIMHSEMQTYCGTCDGNCG